MPVTLENRKLLLTGPTSQVAWPIAQAPDGSCSSSPLVKPSPSESWLASVTVQVLLAAK